MSSVAKPSQIRLDMRRAIRFCFRLPSRAGRTAELTKADTLSLSLFGGVLPSTNLLKGKEQGKAATGGIRAFFRTTQPREQPDPIGSPTLLIARRLNQHTQDGQGLCHAVQDIRGGDHVVHDSRFGGSLDGVAGCKADRLCQAHHVDQRRGDGTADQSQSPVGKRRQGKIVDQDGVAHKARGSRARAASADLECCSAEGSAVPGCRATPSFGCSKGVGSFAGTRLRPDRTALPSDSQVSRGIHWGDHGVQAGDKLERQGGDDGARCAGSAVQLSPLAVGGHTHAPGRAETVGHGEEAAAAAARQVLALTLYNSGNGCYQNAFVMSWVWATVQAHHHQVGGHIDDRLGRCSGLINTFLSGKFDRLTKVFAWSAIMQQWPRPQQQHDIGEFAMRALPKLRTHLMQGS